MIAYLPQFQALHWPVLARELVALGRLPHRESFQARQIDEIKIYEAMQRCGADAYADKSVLSLSGGEQAMILMARLLATDANVLLVDEPFTSLDPERQLHLSALLQEEVHRGKLVVTIIHDLTLAARLSDRLVLMNKGRVEAVGSPENILSEKNLSSVFNVNAEFGRTDKGPYIIPSIKVIGDEKNVAG
jgi:iron complex transport system ATP-binding protein